MSRASHKPLRMLSLFSGIGGIDLAAEWAGIEVVGQVEIDAWCRSILSAHWPDVPQMADIHEVQGDEFGAVDLVAGGFPCQPYSMAGKRQGNNDNRALWPEMLRVIERCRPTWVLGENVPGFISLGIDDACANLEAIGYQTRALILPACATGALHVRERCFILAHTTRSLYGAHGQETSRTRNAGKNWRLHQRPNKSRMGRSIDGVPAWLDISAIPAVEYGVAQRGQRLKALGNAVVPQQVYPLLQMIAQVGI